MADAPQGFKRVFLQGIDISANVRRVEVEDNDRLIDKAVVVMDDPGGAGTEAPREGNTLLVDMGWGDQHAVMFEGEITEHSGTDQNCGQKQVTLKAFDLSYRIRKRPFQSTNHVGTLSAILQRIVTREPNIGITVGQIEPPENPEFTEAAPLRQTTQNDWDFIVAQSRRYSCRAFVEYNGGKSQFYFIPLARLTQGDPIGRLSNEGMAGRITGFRYDRVAATADARRSSATMDATTGETVEHAAPPPPTEPPHQPTSNAQHRADAAGVNLDAAVQVAGEATETPQSQRPERFEAGTPSDPGRAQQATTQDPTNALGWRARGACVGAIMLRAKGQVEVAGVGGWADGRWYVKKAKHTVRTLTRGDVAPAYTTDFELTR